MRRTARLATGVAVLSIVGFAGAPVAVAQTVDCATYPEACVESERVPDGPAPSASPTPDPSPSENPAVLDRDDSGPAGTVANNSSGPAGTVANNSSGPAGTVANNSSTPSTLPFTGGEVLLLGLVGAGALAGGTALVVAGRRRGVTPA